MNKTSDVIIIGGGIIGCATAYYLAKAGQRNVTVLEGSPFIGNGGSSRNGGGVRQSGRDPRELPIAMWGIQTLWPTLSEELDYDCEYHQGGNLRLGKTEEHQKILQGLTDRAVACGLDVTMITGDEAREICPYLSDEVTCASWCPTDGHANPMTTTLAFYRRARQLGVHFYTNQKVTKIQKIHGRARKVFTEGGNVYEADEILLAAGLQSRDIMASVGLDVPMVSQKCEVIVTEAEPPMFWQMLGTAGADFYGHQTNHGSFVFGGFSGFEDYDKDDGTPINTSQALSVSSRAILQYFPALANAKVVRNWAGWIDMCKDGVPVLSKVDEVPGLTLACAFTGHGFGIGPAVGKLLSELILDEPLSVSLDALRYDRFHSLT